MKERLKWLKLKLIVNFNNERGGFGVKEIALAVAGIVVIGFAITIITGNAGDWVEQLWELFIERIEEFAA